MATQLLNDDGTASMATALMSSHHAFHRDLRCFAGALEDPTRAPLLLEAWAQFRATLHGHHTAEETGVFPDLRARHPELEAALAVLDGHHRAIDPLLERGDRAFAALATERAAARAVIAELQALLVEHLAAEEQAIIPYLRDAREFPSPPDEAALAMYASGFAWSLAGISDAVVEQILVMLPPALIARLPAARSAYDARCRELWGGAHRTASLTSVPDGY